MEPEVAGRDLKLPPSDRTPEDEIDLESVIGYNLKRAYVVAMSGFQEAVGDPTLSPRVLSALTIVVTNPNLTQSDLARRLGVERSGLVAIVDQLEEKGCLRRVMVPGDRRSFALVPTPRGVEICRVAYRRVKEYEDRILDVLSGSERTQLLRLLQKIRKSQEDFI